MATICKKPAPLPEIQRKNEYLVRWSAYWMGTGTFKESRVLCSSEVEASRYAREQFNASKVLLIELRSEKEIWA